MFQAEKETSNEEHQTKEVTLNGQLQKKDIAKEKQDKINIGEHQRKKGKIKAPILLPKLYIPQKQINKKQERMEALEETATEDQKPNIFFDELKDLDNSKNSANQIKHFNCQLCFTTFISRLTLRKHNLQVHGIKDSVICQICEKGFSKKAHLQRHMRLVHKCQEETKPRDVQTFKTEKETIDAEHPTKEVNLNGQLKKEDTAKEKQDEIKIGEHQRKKGKIKAPILLQKFDIPQNQLNKQQERMETLEETAIEDQKPNNLFEELKDLKLSIDKSKNSTNQIKNFQCQLCFKTFISRFTLRKHNLQVHGIKDSLICQICEKGFSRKAHRQRHMRVVHKCQEETKTRDVQTFKTEKETIDAEHQTKEITLNGQLKKKDRAKEKQDEINIGNV